MSPIAMFLSQASPAPMQRDFDKNLLWNTLQNLWVGFLAQLPYIVIGLIVFVVFKDVLQNFFAGILILSLAQTFHRGRSD